MSTSLYLLTNSKLSGAEAEAGREAILKKLNDLKLRNTSFVNAEGETIQEKGDWKYQVHEAEQHSPFNVDFYGPFSLLPKLYKDCGIINSIYRYSLLYNIASLDWFQTFRKELFSIVSVINGIEVVYVADNSCDKLTGFLYMAWEGEAYGKIKSEMIRQLGEPLKNYHALNADTLDYRNIQNFFLDDFEDLRTQAAAAQ